MSVLLSGFVWQLAIPDKTLKYILLAITDSANDEGVYTLSAETCALKCSVGERIVRDTLVWAREHKVLEELTPPGYRTPPTYQVHVDRLIQLYEFIPRRVTGINLTALRQMAPDAPLPEDLARLSRTGGQRKTSSKKGAGGTPMPQEGLHDGKGAAGAPSQGKDAAGAPFSDIKGARGAEKGARGAEKGAQDDNQVRYGIEPYINRNGEPGDGGGARSAPIKDNSLPGFEARMAESQSPAERVELLAAYIESNAPEWSGDNLRERLGALLSRACGGDGPMALQAIVKAVAAKPRDDLLDYAFAVAKRARAARPLTEAEQGALPRGEATGAVRTVPAERHPEADAIWQAVLALVQAQVTRPTYETWLKDTLGVGFDGHTLLVRVGSPFATEWLEKRMYRLIETTVAQVLEARGLPREGVVVAFGTAPEANGHQAPAGAPS